MRNTDEDKEKEEELTRIFIVGALFKIEEKSGQLWTAKITSVQGRTINFTDKLGDTCGVHFDNIKAYRRLRGGVDG
jgi:hypothetical protein